MVSVRGESVAACILVIQVVIYELKSFIIIDLMAEVHILKSSGRVACQGQQMYYELILTRNQYLLRFYDALGKLRLVRPIKLPTESVEIHGVGEYLICYESSQGSATQASIYIVKLSDLRSTTMRYNFKLNCSSGVIRKIRHIFCEMEGGLIVFADVDWNIYLLKVGEDRIECRFMARHDREVTALSIRPQENDSSIVVVSKEAVTFLTFDELTLVLVSSKEQPNLVGYYRGDGFVVHYSKHRQWRNRHFDPEGSVNTENYYLQMDKEAELAEFDETSKFPYEFPINSQLIFQSGRDYLLVLNKSEGVILSIYDEQFRVTQVESNLMRGLEHNSFLTNFKTDEDYNVLLEIRIFGIIDSSCALYQFTISDKVTPSQAFLRKNIHLIFQLNGLIAPIYSKIVHQELQAFLNSKDQYKNVTIFAMKSKELKNEESREGLHSHIDMQQFEEGIKLLKACLENFPSCLDRFLRRVKVNVQSNKTVCYVEETSRFFEYCQHIMEQEMLTLLEIAETINPQESVLRSQDRDQLERIKKLLENMINFLFTFISILKIEVNQASKANQFSKKKQSQRMKAHEAIYNSAKSMFLVAKMLENEEIISNFEDRIKTIAEERQDNYSVWKSSPLIKLDYQPSLLHDHFLLIPLFQEERPEFIQLIKFILANRANFVQNAYFYQSITRIACAPYLDSDCGDLIDNICFHILLKDTRRNNCRDKNKELLTKMAGTALKLKLYPFIKYVIQLCTFYSEHSLAIMLIFSGGFSIPGDYDVTDSMKQEHLFTIKSLIIANRLDLAQLYVLDHYSPEMFQEFAKLAHAYGSTSEVLQLNEKGFILPHDQHELKDLLQIDEKRWSILFDEPQSCIKEMDLKTATS